MTENLAFDVANLPVPALLRRPKRIGQAVYDFLGAPLRFVLLPDKISEQLGWTSLRAERMAAVLPEVKGRLLDVGAGDNLLIRLYERQSGVPSGQNPEPNIGLDVEDWGGGCQIISSCHHLPFPDSSFDTVSFVACINHVPERLDALREARRLLRPEGRLVLTMINKLVGWVGHQLWWYSEDKHRHTAKGELPGLDPRDVLSLLQNSGFRIVTIKGFGYGLNTLYVADRR